MSYAVRNDGRGWRSVNGIEDVMFDEAYSETEPGPPAPTKDDQIAQKLNERGLTLGNEWLLYSGIAGMLAIAAAQGKTEAQAYAENPGYRNAKDLATWIAAKRSAL